MLWFGLRRHLRELTARIGRLEAQLQAAETELDELRVHLALAGGDDIVPSELAAEHPLDLPEVAP